MAGSAATVMRCRSLIRLGDGEREERAPSNVSTMIIRPPQPGDGRKGEGLSASLSAALEASAPGEALGRGEQLSDAGARYVRGLEPFRRRRP